jgi:hydrophobic/amphiphilic exporter-1 (mainly G- bacteria), HAE1 family
MWLTTTAVARPISTMMGSFIVLLLGWVSLTNLRVDLMPEIEYPTISVKTLYPGASPEEIESMVARPLEKSLSSVNGLEKLNSRCLEGANTIRLQFGWGTNLDSAISQVRQFIDKVEDELPEDIESPIINRYDVNGEPILFIGVQSETSGTALTRLLEQRVVPRLERLPGVARVGVRGEAKREIHINLDRQKLEALHMGVNEVVDALHNGNVAQPAGDFEEGNMQRLLRSRTEFSSLDDIRSLIVRNVGDAIVRLNEIAEVIDGEAKVTELTRTNGQPGVMVYVYKQSGANTIEVCDVVRRAVDQINLESTDAHLMVRQDESKFIRSAINNVRDSALVGMGLAMLVLIVFLRSFRSAMIIAVSMPLSVLAAFVMIYFSGFTLNMVSFGGLVLGIGMLVDNSIVVLESIARKQDAGLNQTLAAIEGTREVASAIAVSTFTTIIVFVPLLFVDGITGVLVHQLAYVVSFSLLGSLVASVTLTPALAANWGRLGQLSKPATSVDLARIETTENGGGWFETAYSKLLLACLRLPAIPIVLLMVAAAIAVGLLPRIGTEFLPATDDGQISIAGEMSPGIQLATLDRQTATIEKALAKIVPEGSLVSAFIGDGADDGDGWNECRLSVQLSEDARREHGSQLVRMQISEQLPPIAGMKLKVRTRRALPQLQTLSAGGDDNLAVIISGHDTDMARELAKSVADLMQSIPGIVNVSIKRQDQRPDLAALVDREKARIIGINVRDITQALETTIRGALATVYREDGDEFDVLVRLRESDRDESADIGRVGVATHSGLVIPLRSLMELTPGESPLTIDRQNRQRIVVVSASTENRDLGAVVSELQSGLAELPKPPGFDLSIDGEWEQQQESFTRLSLGLALAILLMYALLAAQFESLRDPLIILGSLPFAGLGVIFVLVFWQTTLNAQSFIGIIVLSGIVVNNAIVLVDYVNQLARVRSSATSLEIVHQAAKRRLRPIFMTTLTTVLGMIPLALGWGEGSELQTPLARVLLGGLLSGTIITLVIIPVLCRSCCACLRSSLPDTLDDLRR